MSERILNAIIQLFAIIAKVDTLHLDSNNEVVTSIKGTDLIRKFLQNEINPELIDRYIADFNVHLNQLRKRKTKKNGEHKRDAVNSVKVLRICTELNAELTNRQKFVVLVRLLELILEEDTPSEQDFAFVRTVSESFHVELLEYNLIKDLLLDNFNYDFQNKNVLRLSSEPLLANGPKNNIHVHSLKDPITVVYIPSINLLFFKYFGEEELTLNGQILVQQKVHLLNQGSTLKTKRSQPIYHSDLLNRFISEGQSDKFTFEAKNISFSFNDDTLALHPIDFIEESGKLVGIMGGSGTGKSTLVNVFNGVLHPNSGSLKINGYDIHRNPEEVEGLIGNVSQDDLLIEELNVFENLFYCAKLSFNQLNDQELGQKVISLLKTLGLYEIKSLKVGNPLDKMISGGQRKRLNIALELIREPSVLFIDEPTSGLSSRDSMNIMNLLKELAFKGKLIFVVIHQPSSEIYKLFDRLLLMDQGGYPVFDGNPIDALVYFKRHVQFINAEDSECVLCGNVNPEQIFDILEAEIVDEYGNSTSERKTPPEHWYQLYQKEKPASEIDPIKNKIKSKSNKPSWIEQFKVFFARDAKSKVSNAQYVIITLLEAPVLGILLSFFLKYFSDNGEGAYIFYKNENLPQFIFISIVVALFLGMTVAAEEINKDKKILKRERFLNLSRSSYLASKTIILFMISAVQSLLFVLVANTVLEINDLWLEYWIVLFSVSSWANIIGLNISSAFNLAKVIYIIVPILIIPQLLFSGAIVKFDKLHPSLSHPTEVPLIGNLMTSRWAYEAITVKQATENAFEATFFDLQQKRSQAKWKKDYWIPELMHLLNEKDNVSKTELIKHEIQQEDAIWANIRCSNCFTNDEINKQNIFTFLKVLKLQYTHEFNSSNDQVESIKLKMGIPFFDSLKNENANESLRNIVRNRFSVDKIIIEPKENRLLKLADPIYSETESSFLKSPMYAPKKIFFGHEYSTFVFNLFVIWFFSAICFVALYFDLLKKIIDLFRRVEIKRHKKRVIVK